jgi:hypothetical protein
LERTGVTSPIDEIWKDARFKNFEGALVPKEIGFPYGEMAGKNFDLVASQGRSQETPEADGIADAEFTGRGDETPLQVPAPFFREMEPQVRREELAESDQIFFAEAA